MPDYNEADRKADEWAAEFADIHKAKPETIHAAIVQAYRAGHVFGVQQMIMEASRG